MELALVGGAYRSSSLNLNAQTCINLYPERDKHGGKYPSALFPSPGLTLFLQKTGNSVRGMFEMNNLLYVVIDNKFYIVDANANYVAKGTLKTGVGPVSIWVNDPKQVWIVDGLAGYVYSTVDDEFELITDENFIAPRISGYQDGFGIYIQPNSNIWWITMINNFKIIDPLDFYSLSGTPDDLVSLVSSHQELWLFNRRSAEVWYNTGDTTTFFERRQGLLIEYGARFYQSLRACCIWSWFYCN